MNKEPANQKEILLKEIGDKIREIRKTADLSQEELAFSANISREELNKIEMGKAEMKITTLRNLCMQLKVTADQIVFPTHDRPTTFSYMFIPSTSSLFFLGSSIKQLSEMINELEKME